MEVVQAGIGGREREKKERVYVRIENNEIKKKIHFNRMCCSSSKENSSRTTVQLGAVFIYRAKTYHPLREIIQLHIDMIVFYNAHSFPRYSVRKHFLFYLKYECQNF